jgi:hypothetical protein
VVGDSGGSTRTGTPVPAAAVAKSNGEGAASGSAAAANGRQRAGGSEQSKEEGLAADGDGTSSVAGSSSAGELTSELQARLRKLDRLEPKYAGKCHWILVGWTSSDLGQSSYDRTALLMHEYLPLNRSRPLFARTPL